MGSGARANLKLRGDKTVDAPKWPAEVLLEAIAPDRAWAAELWALDKDGKVLAAGETEGYFAEGEVRTVRVALTVVGVNQDGGGQQMSGDGALAVDGGVGHGDARFDRDGGPAAMESGAPADSGRDAAVDASSDAARDASSQTTDGGHPSPEDAGGPRPLVDASGNRSCSAEYPSNTACQRCACERCAGQINACYASESLLDGIFCRQALECAERNHCTGQGCYCGGTTALACLAPAGPCLTEIETAAGGMGLTAVQNASADPENPLARSVAVGECQLQNCRSECGL